MVHNAVKRERGVKLQSLKDTKEVRTRNITLNYEDWQRLEKLRVFLKVGYMPLIRICLSFKLLVLPKTIKNGKKRQIQIDLETKEKACNLIPQILGGIEFLESLILTIEEEKELGRDKFLLRDFKLKLLIEDLKGIKSVKES